VSSGTFGVGGVEGRVVLRNLPPTCAEGERSERWEGARLRRKRAASLGFSGGDPPHPPPPAGAVALAAAARGRPSASSCRSRGAPAKPFSCAPYSRAGRQQPSSRAPPPLPIPPALTPPLPARSYANVFDALIRTTKEEGVGALYKGLGPNILRGMSMNVGMLACYDQAKELVAKVSSGGAGGRERGGGVR
jgi:hypothetical protein